MFTILKNLDKMKYKNVQTPSGVPTYKTKQPYLADTISSVTIV